MVLPVTSETKEFIEKNKKGAIMLVKFYRSQIRTLERKMIKVMVDNNISTLDLEVKIEDNN